MTRNHDRPPIETDRYVHAETAKRLGLVIQHAKTNTLMWAREMHLQWKDGRLAPRTTIADPKDEAKIRRSMKPELLGHALKSIVRGENEQRMRSLIRALRTLDASADPKDKKAAGDLSMFLGNVWGVRKAYEVVAEGDVDDMDELREQWGDVQLPPPHAKCGLWVADELLISAAVRRLG